MNEQLENEQVRWCSAAGEENGPPGVQSVLWYEWCLGKEMRLCDGGKEVEQEV